MGNACSSSSGEYSVNPLKIGAVFPDFTVKTTMHEGGISMHDWLLEKSEANPTKPWTVLFTHPKDFTPVCTTEMGRCHQLSQTFAKLNTKLIGISCDSVEEHKAWSMDVLGRINAPEGEQLAFPIIADSDREIVSRLGMLDPEEKDATGVPLPARALVILCNEGAPSVPKVKLTILYPATTGRNFDEVIRCLVSVQMTKGEGLATPVDWKYGDRVVVGPGLKTEDAEIKFGTVQTETLVSKKGYLRTIDCPEQAKIAP